jgi:hypothetical protein
VVKKFAAYGIETFNRINYCSLQISESLKHHKWLKFLSIAMSESRVTASLKLESSHRVAMPNKEKTL